MKVLLATGLYPPDIGGPATYAKMIEQELPKHNVEVVVLPFLLVRKYTKIIRHFVYTWKLWRLSKAADVVYALDPISVGVPAAVVAKFRRKRLLLRLGGDYAWEQGTQRFGVVQLLDEFVRTRQQSWQVRVLQYLQTWVARRSIQIIVPSNYLKNIVTQWGIDERKIRVIYSVLFPLYVEESKTVLRQNLSLSGPTILSAGRLVSWKGFAALIRAVHALQVDVPDIQLVIAGDGPEKEHLSALVQQLGGEKFITFTGRLSKAELGKFKKAADVFVLNTGYEGLSHELLEVIALSTPIVTTKVGGNPELITDGVSGSLVEYDNDQALQNAIINLLEDRSLADSYTAAAQKQLHQFTIEQSIAKLLKILEQ